MYYKICEICNLRSGRTTQKRMFMARFPLDEERCRKWVIVTGKEHLAYLPIQKLHTLKHICGKHFTDKDFSKKKKSRLKRTAVPSLHLSRPPLDEEWLDFFPFQVTKNLGKGRYEYRDMSKTYTPTDQKTAKETNSERLSTTDPLEDDTKQSDYEILGENDVSCTEVEYLEEDSVSDRSDNITVLKETQDTDTPSKSLFEQNFKLTLDEIDFLFLSYAKTFRTLAKQFQIMLKLDIAKLFARYETKNAPLSTPEASKPVEQLVPIVKPPLLRAEIPPPAGKPPPEQSIFITSKEENKTIFRRVPLQAVISAESEKSNSQVIQQSSHVGQQSPQVIPQSPQVLQKIPQIIQKSLQVKQKSPQVIQKSPQVIQKSPQVMQQSSKVPQEIIPLQKKDIDNCDLFEDIPRRFRPILKFKSTQQNPSLEASEIAPPPPKMMKYYLPKKGPAYAIVSKDSLQTQGGSHDPDLEMDVLEPVPTETVFVTTDNVTFSEQET